jgi:pyrroline-5-carboxylate reductase
VSSPRLAFIGGGNMGAALASGLIASGAARARDIRVTDVRPEALRSLKKRLGVRVGTDNAEAVRASRVVVLCVKPQQMAGVLAGLAGAITSRHLVVSIAAGVRTDFIEKALGPGVPVVRVMPNTPALHRAGALVFCPGRRATRAHERLVRRLLGAAGAVWKTTESRMDAVTALSGSGPAYVFLLAECLASAGAKAGLPKDLAEALARQTVYGAGLMLSRSAEPAGTLRERVTSPGGTTAAALKVLKDGGLGRLFDRALAAAKRRSRELSRAR